MNVGDILTADIVANTGALEKTGDWWNWVILALTVFLSVKDALAHHVRPKRKFFKKIFYKSEDVVTGRVLEILGYPPEKYGEFRRKVDLVRKDDSIGTLVQILADSTKQSENIVWASHKTQYYIDTMGAAHNKEICSHMVSLLEQLRVEVEGTENVDFVFSMKEANIPLCSAYANEERGIISIMAKDVSDKSYVTTGMNEISAGINFEGFSELEKAYQRNRNRKLRGIAIACNLSNGTNMLQRILAFNKAIQDKNLQMSEKVEPITKVFILYRANNDMDINGRPKLDAEYEQHGITCYRYFDLSEELKNELFKIHSEGLSVNRFKCVACINTNKKNAKLCEHSGKCYRYIKGVNKKNKNKKS